MLYVLLIIIMAASLLVLLRPVALSTSLPIKQKRRFILLVSLCFAIGGFGLYRHLGSPEMVPLLAEREVKLAELKATITSRLADIKTDPKNLGAWIELGQSFIETGQYSAASNAFRQATLLSGGKPIIILAYAKAQIMEAGGKVTDDAKRALDMVILQEPQDEEARYWLAVRLLQEGKTQDAMAAMKTLYRSLPAGSPIRARIDAQIGK